MFMLVHVCSCFPLIHFIGVFLFSFSGGGSEIIASSVTFLAKCNSLDLLAISFVSDILSERDAR